MTPLSSRSARTAWSVSMPRKDGARTGLPSSYLPCSTCSRKMQEVMQAHFSVFRRGDTLNEGLEKLTALRDPLERVTVDDDATG